MNGDRIERLINILKHLNATEYITGPAAKNYLNDSEQLFAGNQIKLSYKSYQYPEYRQLCSPFEHGVSILDLIANVELPEVKRYLWTTNNNIL